MSPLKAAVEPIQPKTVLAVITKPTIPETKVVEVRSVVKPVVSEVDVPEHKFVYVTPETSSSVTSAQTQPSTEARFVTAAQVQSKVPISPATLFQGAGWSEELELQKQQQQQQYQQQQRLQAPQQILRNLRQ